MAKAAADANSPLLNHRVEQPLDPPLSERIAADMPPPPPLTLWQKIAKAMELVGYVQKRGRNQFHKYSYATASDVAEKAREAFLEVGLLFLPTIGTVETREKATSKGGLTYVTRVTMTYIVRDVAAAGSSPGPSAVTSTFQYEDASAYVFQMVGEGQDDGDKSVYKAITGCHKYAILQLLMVSTGDDPESDPKTDEAKPVEPTITDEQREGLANEIEMRGRNLDKLLAYFHLESLGDMTVRDYQRALKMLEGAK